MEYVTPAAVFVPTQSGATAHSIARFRRPVWLIAFSPEPKTCQSLQFSSGIHPLMLTEEPESWRDFARDWNRRHGDMVLLTSGPSEQHPDTNHRMEIIEL